MSLPEWDYGQTCSLKVTACVPLTTALTKLQVGVKWQTRVIT